MSNFESKHPRAKDGRFTEKRRAEASLHLVPDLAPESEPESPQDKPFRETKYENGQISSRTRLFSLIELEYHFVGNTDPLLSSESFRENGTLQGRATWHKSKSGEICKRSENFDENGVLRRARTLTYGGSVTSIDGRPAIEEFYENGQISRREWRELNGDSTQVSYNRSSEITKEVRFDKGHRTGEKTNPVADVTPIFG